MKPIYIIFGICLLGSTAFSQDSLKLTDHAKSDAVVERLTRELNLNAVQKSELYSAMQKRWTSIAEATIQNRPVDWRSINKMTLEQLKLILTAPQLNVFYQLRQETNKQKEQFKKEHPSYEPDDVDLALDF